MAGWTNGAIFGLAWLIFFMPIHLCGTIWFWMRRDIQPIKARSPALVVVTDIVLGLYILLLCLNRIVVDDYPCLLTLWSGYLGTVVLFNTYLWRCWTLYFTFHMTQQKLAQKSLENLPFFIRNKHYISTMFLIKVFGTLTVALCLPAGLLASTHDLTNFYGDVCPRAWGDALLGVYVVGYVIVFCWFAWSLRTVVDGFKIKAELKFTSVIGVAAVVPWFIFNQFYKDFNTKTFPMSTLFLIVAAVAAYCASTLWPLYRSIFQAGELAQALDVPANVSTLRGLLSTKEGFESFQRFLTKEFSVENILFYQEVVELRQVKRDLLASNDPDADLKLLGKFQGIYAKYIIIDAPYQVNLPDLIVRKLQIALNNEFAQAGKKKGSSAAHGETKVEVAGSAAEEGSDADLMLKEQAACPTVFDAAQTNIFNLMNTDSFPRYRRTPEYAEILKKAGEQERKARVLNEMGLTN